MLACEVLVSDVQGLNDALTANETLLAEFATYLERPAPLDPIRTSYFCRVFALLLQKKTGEVRRRSLAQAARDREAERSHADRQMGAQTLAFMQSQPRMLEALLQHLDTSAVIDLLVRIVSCAENPSGTDAIKARLFCHRGPGPP
jgi:hypothetical protein